MEEKSRQLRVSNLREKAVESRQRMNPRTINFILYHLHFLRDILQGRRIDEYRGIGAGSNPMV